MTGHNIKKTGHKKIRFLTIVTALVLGVASAFAMPGAAIGAGASISKTIHLDVGKAGTVELPDAVADVLVANPSIADVGSLRSNRLFVVGKTVGDTNVLAFDESGEPLADIAVHVRIDEKTLKDTIHEFFPSEDIQIKTVNNNIILSGSVSNPGVANQVRDLAGRFVVSDGQSIMDLMKVKGEQQVVLKVKVIEANRSALREYGIETDYKDAAMQGVAADASGLDFSTIAGTGLTQPNPFLGGQLFFDDNQGFGPLKVALQALERQGLVNTLAEPNLTAISGETAGFLAGGEFPVPVGRDNEGNVTLEFKQFGVSLNFTPVVMSKDRISMQLATEVSALSDSNGLELVGTNIPGLTVRRAQTTVEMGSGGSIMIAGLIQSDTVNSFNGVPGIMDVPILGDLFKSKSFERNETELVIIVTPYLVEPFAKPEAELANSMEPEKVATLSPLSKTFLGNLNRIYGDRVPDDAVKGPAFGYLVD